MVGTSVGAAGSLDVLIVTAIKEEYDAVLKVHDGAEPASTWRGEVGPLGLEIAFRSFLGPAGRTLSVAVTRALEMGGVAAAGAAAPLVHLYRPRCLAMCGVCAGRRGKVNLGDVIVADRLWQYDLGAKVVETDEQGREVQRFKADLFSYNLNPRWRHKADRFLPSGMDGWVHDRPRSQEDQAEWLLARLHAGDNPRDHVERKARCAGFDTIITLLRERGWLEPTGLHLSPTGRAYIEDRILLHPDGLPEQPAFAVRVGPIATGTAVVRDPGIFGKLSDQMRKVLGLEMEAAAIGAIAHLADIEHVLVMKGVMDYADSSKGDDFKPFAARASAECLIAFLRENLDPHPDASVFEETGGNRHSGTHDPASQPPPLENEEPGDFGTSQPLRRSSLSSKLLRRLPRLHGRLVDLGIASEPADRADLRAYLLATAGRLAALNAHGLGNVDFLSPDWSDLPRAPSSKGDWGTSTYAQNWRSQVRDRLRSLKHNARGRPGATAQLIAAENRTHHVRDLVEELENADEPLVLLGDPGSGKSTTLRALGNSLARRFASAGEPRAVVYVQLGYFAARPGQARLSVPSLIRRSIPIEHRVIRDMVSRLASEERLIVLFDGLDELAHREGRAAAEALSVFAREHQGRVKCVFACRTLEFDPAFGHRQILILPFDHSHIRSYLKGALPDQVYLEGGWIPRRQVIRHFLEAGDATRDILQSPMLLYLACFYLLREKKWPDSRRDVFACFLTDFEGRAGADGEWRFPQNLRDGWRALAYQMAHTGTTVWMPSPLSDGQSLRDAVASGLAAGLLRRDGDTEDRVRFTHHRFQEYLTAEYIAEHPDALRETALDEPRWHETLLDLAAMRADSPAIASLFATLETTLDDDPSGVRRAYRLHLAARILVTVRAPGDPVYQRLCPLFEAGLRDVAAHGTPPAQVVALWAYALVPELPWDIIREGPLRSTTDWVREQALSLDLRGGQADDDLAEQLLLDVLKGRLSLRVGAYVRATSRTKRNRALLIWAILWTSLSGLLSAILMAWPCAEAAQTIVYRLALGLQQSRNALSIVTTCLVAAAIMLGTVTWAALRIPLAVAWRGAAGVVIATVALWLGISSDAMRDGVSLAAMALAASGLSAALDPIFRIPEIVAIWGGLLGFRRIRARQVLSNLHRDPWIRAAMGGVVLVAVSVLIFLARLTPSWLVSSRNGGWAAGFPAPRGDGLVYDASWPAWLLSMTTVVAYGAFRLLQLASSQPVPWWLPLSTGIFAAGVLASETYNLELTTIALTIPGAGWLGFLIHSAVATNRWRRAVLAWIPSATPTDIEDFLAQILPKQQRFVLSLLTPSLWKWNWAEYALFLARLAPHITAEPAQSVYWAKMHEANEGIRQHHDRRPSNA